MEKWLDLPTNKALAIRRQPGLVAATVLRQYCDFTPEQAIKYWIDGTDTIENSNYPAIKKKIENFIPFPEFKISDEIKTEICYQLNFSVMF